jgi:hypothetical protein
MAAVGKDNRHAPALRSVPPALALRPDHPMHYALLLTNDPQHKTESGFRSIGILFAEISLNAHKGGTRGGNGQAIYRISAKLALKALRKPASECRPSAKKMRNCRFPPKGEAARREHPSMALLSPNLGRWRLWVPDGRSSSRERSLQYAIRAVHRNGETEPLADHSGVLNFPSRGQAERMRPRLAFSGNGDSSEVTKLPS